MIRSNILAESLHKNHSLISLREGETATHSTVKLLIKLMGLRQTSLSLAENAFYAGAKSQGCDFE